MTKGQINKLAEEIYNIEMQAQKIYKTNEDKSLKSLLSKIEMIIGELSPEEVLELDGAVLKKIKNN